MIWRRIAIQAFFFALVITVMSHVACSRHTEGQATPFPASNEVAGWVKTGDARTFAASELWSYIDGDAERYVKAGVQSTTTSDYKFQDRFEAVADVYVMTNAEGARTILNSETASQSQALQLGDGGRLYSGSLVFCKGKYLVRIVAYKEGTDVQQALRDLGRAIDQRLS